MAFKRYRGKTKTMYFRKGDTTRGLKEGSVVQVDSGLLHTTVANDSTNRIIGVCKMDVAITDTSSWIGAPMVPVEVPVESAVEWLIDLDSDGGAADTDIGMYCGLDTTTDSLYARYADVSDTAVRSIYITGRVGSTKIIGVFCNTAWDKGIGDSAMG